MGKVYRVKKVLELLGICRNTLRNWEREGKIESLRDPFNNYRLYPEFEVTKMLKELEKNTEY